MRDVIQDLRELRQSSASSVDSGHEQSTGRPTVEHPLDGWLQDLILDQLTTTGPRLSLILISGNSGDGKSFLLRLLRNRLRAEMNVGEEDVHWLLDATHSEKRTEHSVERLSAYFAPFRDDGAWEPGQLHVIAINTGAAVQFMEHDRKREDKRAFADLDHIVCLQTGIRGGLLPADLTDRYRRVLVVDLDRRVLVPLRSGAPGEGNPEDGSSAAAAPPSFFEQQLDRAIELGAACDDCDSAPNCPVRFNLNAIERSPVRRRLLDLLRDIALEDRVHLNPRGLWHVVYFATVGGLDASRIGRGAPLATCADVAGLTDPERFDALFFNALFSAPRDASDSSAILRALNGLDPCYVVTLDGFESGLRSVLSGDEDKREAADLASGLGCAVEVIAPDPGKIHSSLRSRAAVRRRYFFGDDDSRGGRQELLDDWVKILIERRTDVLSGREVKEKRLLKIVDTVLRSMFGAENRSRPNDFRLPIPWQSQTDPLVEIGPLDAKKERARDLRVAGPLGPLGPDNAELLPKSVEGLCDVLDAQPLSIPVSVSLPGESLTVDVTWPLYRVLRKVEGEYLPGSLVPERFQHLRRLGTALASRAQDRGVVVVESRDSRKIWRCKFDPEGFDVDEL